VGTGWRPLHLARRWGRRLHGPGRHVHRAGPRHLTGRTAHRSILPARPPRRWSPSPRRSRRSRRLPRSRRATMVTTASGAGEPGGAGGAGAARLVRLPGPQRRRRHPPTDQRPPGVRPAERRRVRRGAIERRPSRSSCGPPRSPAVARVSVGAAVAADVAGTASLGACRTPTASTCTSTVRPSMSTRGGFLAVGDQGALVSTGEALLVVWPDGSQLNVYPRGWPLHRHPLPPRR
jgi:hypothetical protein